MEVTVDHSDFGHRIWDFRTIKCEPTVCLPADAEEARVLWQVWQDPQGGDQSVHVVRRHSGAQRERLCHVPARR